MVQLTQGQTDQSLALASAAWAFLDAESRGIGSEVGAALQVFQASWNAWSTSVLAAFSGSSVPRTLRVGSWDAATANAIRSSLAVVLQDTFPVDGGFTAAQALAAVQAMPDAAPPSAARGVWFGTTLAMRFLERSTDPVVQILWQAARAVRGAGTSAGANLSEFIDGVSMGAAVTPATMALAQASLEAGAAIQQGAVAQELPPVFITAQRARPQTEIPWTPIIIGTGVLLLGGGLALAMANGKLPALRRALGLNGARGLRGLGSGGYRAIQPDPHPVSWAERQSRWR